jgi:hypothetical protein
MLPSGKVQSLLGLAAVVFVVGAVQTPVARAQAVPIDLVGYNKDVIIDADPVTRFTQPFDGGAGGLGDCAWFEAGAVDDAGTAHVDGLPAGLTFVSATGSGATYMIQPADVDNVLQLDGAATGTLILVTPDSYSQLFIIAASGNAGQFATAGGVINYASGNTQPFTFNDFDWFNMPSSHPEAVIHAGRGCNIGPAGTGFDYDGRDFAIFETIVTTDPTDDIVSIDFMGDAAIGKTNIFGVSGQP